MSQTLINLNVTNTIVGLLSENITGAQGIQLIQSFWDDPVAVLIDSSLFTRQTHDTGFNNLRIVYEAPGMYTNTQPYQNLGIAQGSKDESAPESPTEQGKKKCLISYRTR